MTAEEIDIVVNASVEKATKEFEKLVPSIKKQLSAIKKEFNNTKFKEVTAKVNVGQLKEQIKKAKKDIQNAFDPNDISEMKINGKSFKINNISGYSKEAIKLKGHLEEVKKAENEIGNIKSPNISKNVAEKRTITGARTMNLESSSVNMWSILKEKISSIKSTIQGVQSIFKNTFNSKKPNAELELLNIKIAEVKNKLHNAKINLDYKSVLEAEVELNKLNLKKQKLEDSSKLSKEKNNMNSIARITIKIRNQIQQWGSSIKQGVGQVLKYAGALFSLRGIYSTLSSSANSWLSSQNAQARQLSANIEYMKYAMGSVFAPVIEYVTSLIYNLMKAMQSLVYAFSGVNIFAKATANSMKSASNSAKQTNKSLSSVHSEINNVSDNNSSGNGSATPSIDLSQVDNSMLTWAKKWKEKLSKFFIPFKEAWNNQGQKTIDSAKNAFEKTKEAVISVGKSWNEVWSNGTGQKTIELILQIFQNVCDIIANIAEAWNNAWNNDNRGTEIVQNLWNGFNNLLEIIKSVVQTIEEWTKSESFQNYANAIISICKTFSSLFEKITAKLKEVWENGGKETFENLLESCSKLVQVIDEILKALQPAMDFGNSVVQPLIEGIIERLGGIFETLGSVLDFVTGIFQGDWSKVWKSIGNIFSTIWNNMTIALNNIKNIWSKIWNGLKTTVINIFNGIWDKIKRIINSILSGIEGMANGIVKGINKVIGVMNNLKFDIPDWIPGMGGKKFGFNIGMMQEVSLPRLAKGNVAYDKTLAIFGEYSGARSNPEITAPQSILKDTFEDVLSNCNNENNDRPINLIVNVGSTKLGQILLDNLRDMKRQSGKDIEALVGG